jgi:hypothetical protein
MTEHTGTSGLNSPKSRLWLNTDQTTNTDRIQLQDISILSAKPRGAIEV